MKKFLIVGTFALLVSLLAVVMVQAAPPQPFYLEKVCDYPPNVPLCGLQGADLTSPYAVLNGGAVEYLGPVEFENAAGIYVISSEVLLTAPDGSTVSGHFVWVADSGYFTLRQGTGALAGFHAQGVIEWKEGVVYSLTGTYH
jgi:hypothetical protein